MTKFSGMGRFTYLWGPAHALVLRAHVELRYKNNKAVRHYVEEVTLQDNKMAAIKLPQRLLQPWVNVSLLGFIRQAYIAS